MVWKRILPFLVLHLFLESNPGILLDFTTSSSTPTRMMHYSTRGWSVAHIEALTTHTCQIHIFEANNHPCTVVLNHYCTEVPITVNVNMKQKPMLPSYECCAYIVVAALELILHC